MSPSPLYAPCKSGLFNESFRERSDLPPLGSPRWAKSVHEVWQIDAKEKVLLANGERVCWLSIGDEKSRAALAFKAFAFKQICQVPPEQIQAFLIAVFERWGLPDQIKVDNGHPLGNFDSDLPSALGFWLLALGVEWITNPPYRPQCNGVVEHLQSVSGRWACPAKLANIQSLQKQLDQIQSWQREGISVKTLGGKTRIEQFPQLIIPRRAFAPHNLSLRLIAQYLSEKPIIRKASEKAQIYLMGTRHCIGSKHKGKECRLIFDPQSFVFLVFDSKDRYLCPIVEHGISFHNILNLRLPKPKKIKER